MTKSRRTFLQLLAGAPLLAFGLEAEAGKVSRIARLIGEARAYPDLSQRIDFISRSLLGVRYQVDTLIGGPRRPEIFVVRDDAFDCVTYCETVLAAAMTGNIEEFETMLRRIRYDKGDVRWDQRNHDFAKWSQRAVENKLCRPVSMSPSISVEKTLSGGGLGKRRFVFVGIPISTLRASRHLLHSGDIIGFVSRQSNLDFFHTGFVVLGKGGAVLLRHASQSHGRVLDEKMEVFLAANGVRYVTLLRAEDQAVTSA